MLGPAKRLVLPLSILLPLVFVQACGGATSSDVIAPRVTPAVANDPSAPGPYSVGVAELKLERPSSTTGEPRILDTMVWYPAADSTQTGAVDDTVGGVRDAEPAREGAPFPTIVWSHGAGGSPPYAPLYYAAHLAGYGFVVVAPSHPGNLREDCPTSTGCTAEVMADSYANRPDDLAFALDSMLSLSEDAGSPFYKLLDGERVGVSGHSFGGTDTVRESTTTVGAPFLAALAMAPCVGAVVPPPEQVTMPLMIMGGDRDARCPSADQQTFFDAMGTGVSSFLLIFPRGGHLAYSDRCPSPVAELACGPNDLDQDKAHQLINFYATAFFKTYVAGEPDYAPLLDASFNSTEQDIRYTAHTP
jgi:predicted dienelactone hydrolase